MFFLRRIVRVIQIDQAHEDLERFGVHALRVRNVDDPAVRLVRFADDVLRRGAQIGGHDRGGRQIARRDVVVQHVDVREIVHVPAHVDRFLQCRIALRRGADAEHGDPRRELTRAGHVVQLIRLRCGDGGLSQ